MADMPQWLSRRSFWAWVITACLALIAAVPWTVTRAIHLLNGPSVIVPGAGYSAVAVTPDGRTLYAANWGPDSDGSGHTVTPVDIATGKAGKPIAVGDGPQELAVAPDGRMLYALVSGGITPVNLATGRAMTPIQVTSGAATMAVSPDSRTLFIGTDNNEVVAVDIATDRRERLIALPTPDSDVVGPTALTVTPDGKTLYVAQSDDAVRPVNLATGSPGTPLIVGNPDLTFTSALAITPDGKTLYAAVNGDYGDGSGPNSLVAISTATGTVEKTIQYGTAGPIALAVTPDGRTLYALNGNYDNLVPDGSTVTPVSTADGRPRAAIRTGGFFSHAGADGFAVAPDGRTVYVAQGDVVDIALPRLSARFGLTQAMAGSTPSPTAGWAQRSLLSSHLFTATGVQAASRSSSRPGSSSTRTMSRCAGCTNPAVTASSINASSGLKYSPASRIPHGLAWMPSCAQVSASKNSSRVP